MAMGVVNVAVKDRVFVWVKRLKGCCHSSYKQGELGGIQIRFSGARLVLELETRTQSVLLAQGQGTPK